MHRKKIHKYDDIVKIYKLVRNLRINKHYKSKNMYYKYVQLKINLITKYL